MGAPTRLTGGCPLAVEKRLPNAGASALLAARTSPEGETAISSTRVVPPVAIEVTKFAEAVVAVVVTLKTLSVLLPSPA
jgi:hypothetical protein